MPTFEESVHNHFDARTSILGKIKSRTLGADALTLTALNVLVYAQLDGGIKDLASCVLRDLNRRPLQLGEIKPEILQWRNPHEINRFKSMVDFTMIAQASPFAPALMRRLKVAAINRRTEMNQMGWDTIRRVYSGFGLDVTEIERCKTKIDQIVDDRNEAAHHGVLTDKAASYMEKHVRENVAVVEDVLTHFSLQLLPFFTNRLYVR